MVSGRRFGLGTGVGGMADWWRLHRLGALAAARSGRGLRKPAHRRNVDVEYDIGPEYYNFCDVRFIGEPVLRDRIFPATQNVTYITNTVNVTNIYVQNNVVYNYGPNYDVVNRYSSRPIQRLTIERQSATDLSGAAKSGGLTKVQGDKLMVAAPQ